MKRIPTPTFVSLFICCSVLIFGSCQKDSDLFAEAVLKDLEDPEVNENSQEDNSENSDDFSVNDDNVITLNALKAFPSAIGAGAFARVDPTTATIYEVTNLNTSGAGSFREALAANESRIIIIKVEGLIDDSSDYREDGTGSGNVAIWGQMAPGLGLTIDHPRMSFDRSGNILFRHLTLQGSNAQGCTVNTNCYDPLNFYRVKAGSSTYVDHCSLRYGPDQTWTYNVDETEPNIDTNKSTFAYNLLAEGDPSHSTASIMNLAGSGNSGLDIDIGDHTWSRNMTYNISHRFPNLNANGDFENYNNYVVNWKARLSRYNTTPNVDYHHNYVRQGNLTSGLSNILARGNKLNQGTLWGNEEPSIYSAFNLVEGINTDASSNLQTNLFTWFDTESEIYHRISVIADGPVPAEFFTTSQQFSFNPPADGYWEANNVAYKMENSVGHNRGINTDGSPKFARDDIDTSYFNKINSGTTESTYRATSEWDNSTFTGTALYADTDGDHMPDWFEDQFYFLDKNDSSDMLASNAIWDFGAIGTIHEYVVKNNAGYTNLEICAAFYAGDFEIIIDGTNNLRIND